MIFHCHFHQLFSIFWSSAWRRLLQSFFNILLSPVWVARGMYHQPVRGALHFMLGGGRRMPLLISVPLVSTSYAECPMYSLTIIAILSFRSTIELAMYDSTYNSHRSAYLTTAVRLLLLYTGCLNAKVNAVEAWKQGDVHIGTRTSSTTNYMYQLARRSESEVVLTNNTRHARTSSPWLRCKSSCILQTHSPNLEHIENTDRQKWISLKNGTAV